MKKLLLVLLMAGLLSLMTTPAFAQARYGLQTSAPVEIDTDLVLAADTWVYGYTIFADDASSFAGIYDLASLDAGAAVNAAVEDEIGEATQYDSKTMWLEKPKFFDNGVSVVMTVGVLFIHHGPEPE